MNQHVLAHELEQAVEADLRRTNIEALADSHRHELAKGKQAITDHKRGLKASLASLSADRKAAKAGYEAELARIAEAEAFEKSRAEAAIAEETGLLTYHQAALDAIPE